MKAIHITMPFSRHENWQILIDAYRPMNVIIHPLLLAGENLPEMEADWIHPFIAFDQIKFNQSALLNEFIKFALIQDDDYYVTANDDDMYEPGVYDAIGKRDDPVIVISMKRGYQTPKDAPEGKDYDPTTLFAYPENMRTGFVGGEQIFMKGSVLKTVHFDEELPAVADGFVAEDLAKRYDTLVRYEKDLYALFNYYEPRRWEREGLKISFGVMVSDLVRLDMCLKQSPISGQMHYIRGAESATKGLNKLLNTIEKEGADVACLVHQDMSFKHGWIAQVRDQIAKLPDSWIVAGIIGKDFQGRICGRFHDMRIAPVFDTTNLHTFPHPACCFDECVILVNMKKSFRFDETFDGWDLYGTLCVLQAWEMGGSAFIIDAPAEHHCMRPFTWQPDDIFKRNFKRLYERFNQLGRIDSTALGVPPKEKIRFVTNAA